MAWHDGPKSRTHPQVDAYIAALEPAQRAHVEAMRTLARGLADDVVEGIAWGVPFWFRRGPLCYASAAKAHVTIGIARGVEVHDDTGMLTGTGKSPIRKAVVKLKQPFPTQAVAGWLEQALQLDAAGYD